MHQIAIIGAGNLGSRHLQAISQVSFKAAISVIDPQMKSLKKAKMLLEEVPKNNNIIDIKFLENITDLKDKIDLCIVSCTANIRKDVITNLLNTCKVDNLILEKTLFQKIDDYYIIKEKLDHNNVNTWVNCVMRIWPVYIYIKQLIENEKILQINISGSNWAMGTCLIHYIDLICYLSEDINYKLYNLLLDKKVINSKRKGFIEFTGCLVGNLKNGTVFNISSYKLGKTPVVIEIITESQNILFLEQTGVLRITKKDDKWLGYDMQFEYPYQSGLTNLIAENIILNKTCDLPTYLESMAIHLPMMDSLISHYELCIGRPVDHIPIT